MTLRDELASVLGPGNNDLIAYEQADSVIQVLNKWDAESSEAGDTPWDDAVRRVQEAFPVWLLGSLHRLSSGVLIDIIDVAEKILHDRRASGSFE